MDPQVTWEELLSTWMRRDWEQVVELSGALLEWLGKDGFPPEFCYPHELGRDFNAATVRAACEFAKRRAQSVLENADGIPQGVPFSLSCSVCNNEGPESYSLATAECWKCIQYVPASAFENFLGVCPNCQAKHG